MATASLVVIATCLAGPHVIRTGKFLWNYPERANFRREQEWGLHYNTFPSGKGSRSWELSSYSYEKCVKSRDIPTEFLVEQPKYFSSKPVHPWGPYSQVDWLDELTNFLRYPIDTTSYWLERFNYWLEHSTKR